MFRIHKGQLNRETTPFIQIMNDFRIPVLIWSLLVYASSSVLSIREFNLAGFLIFNGLFFIFLLVNWKADLFEKRFTWFFFLLQGALIFTISILSYPGAIIILWGLLPVLVGQSIGFYYNKRKTTVVIVLSIVIFIQSIVYLVNAEILAIMLPPFLLLIIIVSAYTGIFFQQVHSRLRTQKYLSELEVAYMKVEELTLANERQRMARDLHDTMAQGVAGLILQLEAIEAFIANGNISRAHDTSIRSTEQARSILLDARKAIDNLRLKPDYKEMNFAEAVKSEVNRFFSATGIHVTLNLKTNRYLSRQVSEHILHIMSECMMNVLKHANAKNLWVDADDSNDLLIIEIKDDGEGFNTGTIAHNIGHYGLLGIQERVKLLKGTVEITSDHNGTAVRVKTPINEGEWHETV